MCLWQRTWKQWLWSTLVANRILTCTNTFEIQAAVFPTAFFIILKPIVRNSISLPYHFLNSICLNIQYLLEAAGLVVWNSSWGLSHGSEEGEERIWYLCQCLMINSRESSPNYTGLLWFPLFRTSRTWSCARCRDSSLQYSGKQSKHGCPLWCLGGRSWWCIY